MTTATDRPAANPCAHCGASIGACNGKRLVAGRHCCTTCTESHAHITNRED